MKITGEYCKELADGEVTIKMDVFEFAMLSDLVHMATNLIHTHELEGYRHYLDWFAEDFDIQQSSLLFDPVDKQMMMNRIIEESRMVMN